MYCLQRIIEICHYNLNSRIRIEWSRIWDIVGTHFNQVGCHSNSNVVYFCLDKLRQLSVKFLELEELSNFKFQQEFLRPFKFIFENNPDWKIKDMVLTCVNHMVLYKAVMLRSGWKTVLAILGLAASDKQEAIVKLGFKITNSIHEDFLEFVLKRNFYSDLVNCLSKYCQATRFPKIRYLKLTKVLKLLLF
jgi:brefeldin A-inhibited guanine nucleotide-exchange protein